MDWDILLPFGICVVLPVMIVWLVNRTRQNETNRKTEIMLKAIESGADIDIDFFKTQQKTMNIKERLLKYLAFGGVALLIGISLVAVGVFFGIKFGWVMYGPLIMLMSVAGGVLSAIGIALLGVFLVGRKMLSKEIENEEKALEEK